MVTVKLQYFKPSGKFGYEGELQVDDAVWPYKIFELITAMAISGELPGLSSGQWDGPIYVDLKNHPMAFPAILNLKG